MLTNPVFVQKKIFLVVVQETIYLHNIIDKIICVILSNLFIYIYKTDANMLCHLNKFKKMLYKEVNNIFDVL